MHAQRRSPRALCPSRPSQLSSQRCVALAQAAAAMDDHPQKAAPRVKFTSEALAWNVEAESENVRRSSWPLLPNRKVPLQTFFVYLVNAKGFKDTSAQEHLLRMTYFFGIFDLPTEFSQEGFMAAFFSSGAAEQWAALPIMSPERPTTRNMTSALLHYVDFLILDGESLQHREACRCLNLLRADVLKPLYRRTLKAREVDARATRSKRKRNGEGRKHMKVDGEKEEVEEEQKVECEREWSKER